MADSSREGWNGFRATKPPGLLILPRPIVLGASQGKPAGWVIPKCSVFLQRFPAAHSQAVCLVGTLLPCSEDEWGQSVCQGLPGPLHEPHLL